MEFVKILVQWKDEELPEPMDTLTVGELMSRLSEFDEKLPVVISHGDKHFSGLNWYGLSQKKEDTKDSNN